MVIYNIIYFNFLKCLINYIYQTRIFSFSLIFICINIGYIYKLSKICLKSLFFKGETLRDLVCIDFFYKKKRFSLFYNYLNYNYNISFFFWGNFIFFLFFPLLLVLIFYWVFFK